MSVAVPRTPLETVIDALTARGKHPRGNDKGWASRCPAHEDRNPSLSISQGNDGVVLHCHAGCPTETVIAALDLTMADLFNERANGRAPARQIVATYDYTDETGNLLFQTVRYTPKDFRQRRPNGHGGWLWNLQGVSRVLYHLPDIIAEVKAGGQIWVVEGEKDVDALNSAGIVATCNPMGADSGTGNKWLPQHTATLAGTEIVIVADKDDQGHRHARYVKTQLEQAGCTVHTVEAAEGKDIAAHLALGNTPDQCLLIDLDDQTDKTSADDSSFINWPAFWDETHTDEEWLIEDVLALGRGHAIYATHKQGKSLFALYWAAHVATTQDNTDVVYLDYEMTRADIRERLEDMGYGPDSDLQRLHYALLPSMPPLDTGEGMAALLELTAQVQRPDCHVLVIIDTTARAAQGKENDADTYRDFYRWTGTALKRHGITWARLDHAGKDPAKGQRGSSGKGDDVDVVWRLQATDNGITLHRDAARMSWIPEKVTFTIQTDPLRYERSAFAWPAGTGELAQQLNNLEVPLGASRRQARITLTTAGIKAGNEALGAALRFRREQVQTLPDHPLDHTTPNNQDQSQDQSIKPPLTCVDQSTDQPGPGAAADVDQWSPLKGDQSTADRPHAEHLCRCGQPATDISGLCPACLTNPGTLPSLNTKELF